MGSSRRSTSDPRQRISPKLFLITFPWNKNALLNKLARIPKTEINPAFPAPEMALTLAMDDYVWYLLPKKQIYARVENTSFKDRMSFGVVSQMHFLLYYLSCSKKQPDCAPYQIVRPASVGNLGLYSPSLRVLGLQAYLLVKTLVSGRRITPSRANSPPLLPHQRIY